jgi:16S rRNA (adenine1518-N6/adenine1519-N6)-dimethyltransferase
MPSPRQTQSFLMRRFAEAGIEPDSRHGQNFLIDLNLLDLLLDAGDPNPDDVVLEIGTGMGSLTTLLAQRAAHVVTVEIDARMQQLAWEELIDYPNVTMLLQDALRNKNNLAEEPLAAVRTQLAAAPGRRFKLIANLPYNIATPILSNLLSTDPRPVSLTATIQRELAERIVSPPGQKDYSALSVWMQALCDIEIVRTLPPQAFWPRPRVFSSIVHIVPSDEKRAKLADPEFFHGFVRGLFLHRRKFLRSCIISTVGDKLTKPEVDDVLSGLSLPDNIRAEEMPVEQLINLAEAFRQRLG